MKVLVTGGAGYIGSHACKALARKGFEPITYDNLSRGNRWAVKWGPLEEGEIADLVRLRAVINRHQPVAVMHFAAFAYVGESSKTAAFVLREQCWRQRHPFSRDYRNAHHSGNIFVDMRYLWSSGKNPYSGGAPPKPDQSLRIFQAHGGANVG